MKKIQKSKNEAAISRIQMHRLARIASLLQRNAYPTVDSLLKEYFDLEQYKGIGKAEYCEKTVLRDIKVLKTEFGCPVAYDRREGGYYLQKRNWKFNNPANLSEIAMLTLIIGAKVAEDIFPNPIRENVKEAVDEILKGNHSTFFDTALIKSLIVFAESGAVDVSEMFPILFEAWQKHQSVKIKYDDLEGHVTERVIDPHVLFLYNKEWRVKAYCHLRKEARTFVISRITEATFEKTSFKPDLKLIQSVSRDDMLAFRKVYNVRIRVTGPARKFAIAGRMHSKQSLTPNKDGVSWTYTIPETSAEVIVPWILSQGGNAVPLSPPEIVEDVRDQVKKLSAGLKVCSGPAPMC